MPIEKKPHEFYEERCVAIMQMLDEHKYYNKYEKDLLTATLEKFTELYFSELPPIELFPHPS